MADYDKIAPFYDEIHGSREETIKYVKLLLKEYCASAKTILSLACGTGVIEQSLPQKYQVSGLDISTDMLKEAKKILPEMIFYHQDMTDFSVPGKYDVILCLFAALNHVMEFDDWRAVFRRVKEHLEPGGIFIFDVLSELCLYNLVLNTPLITRRDNLVVIGEFTPDEEGLIDWRVHGHQVIGDRQEEIFHTATKTVAFNLEQIKEALMAEFSEVIVEDPENDCEVDERSELLYFICR